MNEDRKKEVQEYFGEDYLKKAEETDRFYDDLAVLDSEELGQMSPVGSENDVEYTYMPIDYTIETLEKKLNYLEEELKKAEGVERKCKYWYEKQGAHEDVQELRNEYYQVVAEIKNLQAARESGRTR